jgi:hypothetical protein
MGRRGWPKSGGLAGGLGRGRGWGDLGFVRDRLVCDFGAERPPVSGAAVLAAATGGVPARRATWATPTGLRGSKAS